jgi:hypothetical protein
MNKSKRIGSFMNINKVNTWLVSNNLPELNIDGLIISTKKIKDSLDEKTFREMSCNVVTSIYTN